MKAGDHPNLNSIDTRDESAQAVRIANGGELADQIARRTRMRWIVPGALLLTLALAAVVAQVASGYRDRQDQANAETWEMDARRSSEPVTGAGSEVTQIQCALGEDAATYSGRITNTGNAPRDYSLAVRFLDADGVQIGATSQAIAQLDAKASANFRLPGTLVRFARGAPLKRCVFNAEPGEPGCPDVFIVGAKVSDQEWSDGCRGSDRRPVVAISFNCLDGRKLWVNALGFGYSGEAFQTGSPDDETRRCTSGA